MQTKQSAFFWIEKLIGYPAKQYAHLFSCALPTAHTPDGTGVMPGSNPDFQSLYTSSAFIFIISAAAALYTVMAALQTTNWTPLS